jgi:hypothetical protein
MVHLLGLSHCVHHLLFTLPSSLQVQALIDCFPHKDLHLTKFCLHRPKTMTVRELLTLLQCPSCTQGQIGREERVLCEYGSMSMCECNRTFQHSHCYWAQ